MTVSDGNNCVYSDDHFPQSRVTVPFRPVISSRRIINGSSTIPRLSHFHLIYNAILIRGLQDSCVMRDCASFRFGFAMLLDKSSHWFVLSLKPACRDPCMLDMLALMDGRVDVSG